MSTKLKHLREFIDTYYVKTHNAINSLWHSTTIPVSTLPELNDVFQHCRVPTDISDHLPTLFAQALSARPRLMVELGVRGGESTFVLERVAKLCGSKLVSVDIADCVSASPWKDWIFVKSDDIAFAQAWPNWTRERNLPATIDVLFIDTSHLYEHTVQELKHWLPLVAEHGKVLFHDTNQRRYFYRRDGSMGAAWASRGVIQAIEEYFDTRFDETKDFLECRKGWLIQHTACCSGFTVLTRVPVAGETSGRK